jgi:acyl-coenzyme A synthetase/AMP-(fatty) acid ligase
VLINPLLDINLHQNDVRQNPELRAGRVGYLLERHPIYLKKLVIQTTLSEEESIILYWAERLLTVAEIAEQTHIPLTEIQSSLRRLYQLDIIQLVPIAADHLRLQYFVSTQNYCLPTTEKNVAALWRRAVRLFGANTYIWSELDDSELSYQECDDLLQLISSAYQQGGLVAGDHVALIGANHFEAILTSLAAMQMGLVVIPVDAHLAIPVLQHILSETSPKLVFSSVQHSVWLNTQDYTTIYLDEEEEPQEGTLFSEWLEDASEESIRQAAISPNQPACILYTSGSTGIPKGVVLNHGQLVSSGRLITETFHWQSDSRFFSPGELDSMSGFRNHLIAPLEVGASIIIAKAEHKAHLFSLLECMTTYQATILGTTPALLGQLLQFPKRSKPALHQLTTIICTGSNLSPQLKMDFHTTFGIVPLNYYGLTETTGICLAESPDDYQLDQNTVGIPRNCIAQIVDEKGQVVAAGTEGDLRIYSENCTRGYYKQKDKTAALIRQGWLYTGDRALQQKNGHIALLGRTRDIIKTASGQLVFAAEVENCIRQVNHLVSAAAVVGSLEQGDEKIIAFIVLKTGLTASEKELKSELKIYVSENIGLRKTPVNWYFVDQLPVNSSGKVIKQALVDQHTLNN